MCNILFVLFIKKCYNLCPSVFCFFEPVCEELLISIFLAQTHFKSTQRALREWSERTQNTQSTQRAQSSQIELRILRAPIAIREHSAESNQTVSYHQSIEDACAVYVFLPESGAFRNSSGTVESHAPTTSFLAWAEANYQGDSQERAVINPK